MMMIFVLLFVSSWSAAAAATSVSLPLTVMKLPKTSLKQSSFLSSSSDNIAPAPSTSLSYTMVLIVTIPIGTPPQPMDMVVDTGSQLIWVTCASGSANTSTAHMFRPKKSTSFENYFCNNTSDCIITDPTVMNCYSYYHGYNLCNFTYSYADTFHADGFLVKEKVNDQHHHPILLGCTKLLDSTGAQGLMGMNLGNLSFPSQSGISTFSYCVPRQNSTSSSSLGKFYLGANPYSDFRYLSLFNFSSGIPSVDALAYTVVLKCIRVGKNKTVLPSDPVLGDELGNKNGIMIDSASQYSFLVSSTYADLRGKVDGLTEGFNMTGVDNSQPFDMCYPERTDPNAVAAAIGDLVFEFESNVTITVPKERVLDRINNKTCVTIGQSMSSTSATHTLGVSHQQCHWVVYDSKQRRVGFREIGPSCEHWNACY